MSFIAINAIEVPEGAGPELEKRFAARQQAVDGSPGFEGFQLLRPVSGQDRYYVITQWATQADFEAWRTERAPAAHAGGQAPVASGAELYEFEVVGLA